MIIPPRYWEVVQWTSQEIVEKQALLENAVVTAPPLAGEPLVVAIPAMEVGTFRLVDLGDVIWVETLTNQWGERSFRVMTSRIPEPGLFLKMANGIGRQI